MATAGSGVTSSSYAAADGKAVSGFSASSDGGAAIASCPAKPPGTKSKITVSLKTNFTSDSHGDHWHASDADYHTAVDGMSVGNASVEIIGTSVRVTSDRAGSAVLDVTGLPDGSYEVRVTPDRTTLEPVGPAIGNGLPDPLPNRIFWPVAVRIELACGELASAEVLPVTLSDGTSTRTHCRVGHATRAVLDATHLPLDLKPVWMRAALVVRNIAPSLIVVHHTAGPYIGNALNQLVVGSDASANYVVDTDGHVIKLRRDTSDGSHAGRNAYWGKAGVNGFSIGIEQVHDSGVYPEVQLAATEGLVGRLIDGLGIPVHGVVGHSDIARTGPASPVGAKSSDPGLAFDWPRLEARGWGLRPLSAELGVYYGGVFDPDAPSPRLIPGAHATAAVVKELQEDLKHIGYFVNVNGSYDTVTQKAVEMFREHFRSGPSRSSGPDSFAFDDDGKRIAVNAVNATLAQWIKGVRASVPP